MQLPLVSIVIPLYNQKIDYLKACVESAITQTYPNIEIIISDNHSTNECVKLLEEFQNNKIKIIKPETHLPIVDHFTFAAKHAQGEYVSFLSSDDLLYPECIEKVIQPLIKDKSLSFCYCENKIINESGDTVSLVRKLQLASGTYSKNKMANRMYNNSEYWIIGGIIQNKFYKKTGFAKNIIAADWVMGFQLLKYGEVGYINEALSAIRIHEREGEAQEEYTGRHIIHHKQRVEKHNYLIEDEELLKQIGITKKVATLYRDREVMIAVTTIIRSYHKHLTNQAYVEEIFDLYKQSQNSFNFIFLTRFYKSKVSLYYIYLLGGIRKLARTFKNVN